MVVAENPNLFVTESRVVILDRPNSSMILNQEPKFGCLSS